MRIVTLASLTQKRLQGGSDECQGSRESKAEVDGELGHSCGQRSDCVLCERELSRVAGIKHASKGKSQAKK